MIQSGSRTVPFVDLRAANAAVAGPVLNEFAETIATGAFTNGPQVERFEREFADYCRVLHCVGVANGLDALRLILIAAGLQPGDEVLVPAQTFVATYEAVSQAGGRPVPVDIREDDFTIDPAAADAAVTSKTRLILPVHLYGQMADVVAISDVAARHDLTVVEDACQAHGASRDGFQPGAASTAAAFSFYPTKPLGAFGDAGAVVTNDDDIAAAVRALREHGQVRKHEHVAPGYTSRLDTLQAIALAHKLPHLDREIAARRRLADLYMHYLRGVGDITLPVVPPASQPSWHLFVVRTSARDQLADHLTASGIQVGVHYPTPPHLTPAYDHLGIRTGMTPRAEAQSASVLSLPIYPSMTEQTVSHVATAARAYYARHRSR